uniref:NADH dehydrogenase [ubiquinone] 1 alpha subcomplex subunit 11 n=1 Tax=Ixodes ricinus TaxID=34613 RepID=A0A131YAR1_IXORI
MVYLPPPALRWLDLPNKWRLEREEKGIKPFSYYRTPADQEGLEKLCFFTYKCTKLGFVLGVGDAIAISHASGLVPVLGRIGYWTLPFVTAGGAFVATNLVATKLTGKDSPATHFLGGVAAASVFGAKWQSMRAGLWLSGIIGMWAAIRKYSMDRDIALAPTQKSCANFFLLNRVDLTILSPR